MGGSAELQQVNVKLQSKQHTAVCTHPHTTTLSPRTQSHSKSVRECVSKHIVFNDRLTCQDTHGQGRERVCHRVASQAAPQWELQCSVTTWLPACDLTSEPTKLCLLITTANPSIVNIHTCLSISRIWGRIPGRGLCYATTTLYGLTLWCRVADGFPNTHTHNGMGFWQPNQNSTWRVHCRCSHLTLYCTCLCLCLCLCLCPCVWWVKWTSEQVSAN